MRVSTKWRVRRIALCFVGPPFLGVLFFLLTLLLEGEKIPLLELVRFVVLGTWVAFIFVFMQAMIYAGVMELYIIPYVRSRLMFYCLSGILGYLAGYSVEHFQSFRSMTLVGLLVGLSLGPVMFWASIDVRAIISGVRVKGQSKPTANCGAFSLGFGRR